MGTRGVTEAAAEVRGLSVAFGGRRALREDDFDLAARSITMVIGRSGSGKTTSRPRRLGRPFAQVYV